MDLAEAFKKYHKKIVEQWVDYTLSTYKSSSFFRKEGDKFANPVGGAVAEALNTLFTLLAKNAEPQTFVAPLVDIMRIRALQDFAPSEAVSPIHAVKHITRETLAANKESSHLAADLYDFDFSVDMAVLAAFDLYMESRERLYEVRIEELKSGRNIYTDSVCPSVLLRQDKQDIKKKVESI